jgi:hypothetical protein
MSMVPADEPLTAEDKSSLDQYAAISRIMERGFVFPEWSKKTHNSFPPNVRKAIFTTICIWKLRRQESYLGLLPRDLIPMLMGWIATRSKRNTWKWPKLSDWVYSQVSQTIPWVFFFFCLFLQNIFLD